MGPSKCWKGFLRYEVEFLMYFPSEGLLSFLLFERYSKLGVTSIRIVNYIDHAWRMSIDEKKYLFVSTHCIFAPDETTE